MQRSLQSMLTRSLVLIVGLTIAWLSIASEEGLLIPPGKGDHCVADTDFMRRNHMDLIVHQRDDTVIRGIRDEPFSLVECVECHTQRDSKNEPVRIDAQGQFCASCHAYVAVKIDCFGCHAAVPDAPLKSVDGAHWLPSERLMSQFRDAPLTGAAIGKKSQ